MRAGSTLSLSLSLSQEAPLFFYSIGSRFLIASFLRNRFPVSESGTRPRVYMPRTPISVTVVVRDFFFFY
jgi:hypothetical protein